MATHDYVIENSTGANVRADINLVLQAILTNNSSSSAPSTTAAYMWWADTTNGVLKIRNSSNNDWVELLQLDGTLTLEDGTVSAPGLAFRDDLNTGIYSSAADTFNVATGGVERMELGTTTIFNEDGADVDFRIEGDTVANLFYVDAGNNRIGIGTSSPQSQLVVRGSTPIITFEPTADTQTCRLQFCTTDGTVKNSLQSGGSLDSAFRFVQGSSEVVRIDTSGNLGIGTSSPSSFDNSADDLVISTSGNTGITINSGSAGSTSEGNLVFAEGTAGSADKFRGAIQYKHGEDRFSFYTNNSERMRIDSSGNVGIGTTSPESNLHVHLSSASDGPILRFTNPNGGDGTLIGRIQAGDTAGTFFTGINIFKHDTDDGEIRFRMIVAGSNADVLTLVDGNVGIGTTSPNQLLSLQNTSSQCQQSLTAATNGSCAINFGDTDSVNRSVILHHNTGDYLSFSTAATERMRIDSSGRVLLGTTTEGNSSADNLTVADSGESGITVRSGTSQGGHIYFSDATSGTAEYQGAISYQHNGDFMKFNTSASERMRIDSSGNVLIAATTVESGFGGIVVRPDSSEGICTVVFDRTNSSNTGFALSFENNNSGVGSISYNNSSTAFNTVSDYRLKENAVAISDGITRLKTLKPYRFNFKVDATKTVDGFFAHEVTAVPEAVTGTKDEVDSDNKPVYQGIDQSKLVPLLVAAVQELITKVETLEAA